MFLLRRIQCYCTRTCRLWLLSCKHNVVVLFGHVCELILWAGICRLFLFPDFTMVPCRQDVVSFGRVCELILLTGTCIRRLFLFPDFIVTVSVTLLSPPPPTSVFVAQFCKVTDSRDEHICSFITCIVVFQINPKA